MNSYSFIFIASATFALAGGVAAQPFPSKPVTLVVAKLTGQIKAALELPETKTRADGAGIELRYQSPAQLDELVKKDTDFWAKTIKAAGITAD